MMFQPNQSHVQKDALVNCALIESNQTHIQQTGLQFPEKNFHQITAILAHAQQKEEQTAPTRNVESAKMDSYVQDVLTQEDFL